MNNVRPFHRNASWSLITGPEGYLAKLESFGGSSMSAHYEGDDYVVFSYATEIARVRCDGPAILDKWVSDEHYSKTTSKQQNACRAWLPGREAVRH